MTNINKYLWLRKEDLILGISIFLVVLMVVSLSRLTRLNHTNSISIQDSVTLLLPEPGELSELLPKLIDSGVIVDSTEYTWALNLLDVKSYAPGRYAFTYSLSYRNFFDKLVRGLQDPMMVAIPSGQFQDRFVERVSSRFRFSADELERAMSDTLFLSQNGIEVDQIIGRMIPNTYEMYWTISAEQFLQRMLTEFDRAVTDPYTNRAQELGLTLDEITTLASIIEWEVRHIEEKPKVSGLYWNRLNRRMRLQADPTVVYAVNERRRLVFADYRIVHPYNTYRITGLPPGPLNNPRLTSIQAALYPQNHNYLFMVATPEGYHTFTTNYQDHLRESRKWTGWLREQREIRAKMEAQAQVEKSSNVLGSK
jgi:UPF0755 protein